MIHQMTLNGMKNARPFMLVHQRQCSGVIYTTVNFTDEFRNVLVTRQCVCDGSVRGWLGVVGVVDTRLVYKSRPEVRTVNK